MLMIVPSSRLQICIVNAIVIGLALILVAIMPCSASFGQSITSMQSDLQSRLNRGAAVERQRREAFASARKITNRALVEFPYVDGKLDPLQFQEGDLGQLKDMEYSIIQIVDAENMLLSAYSDVGDTTLWLVHPSRDFATGDKVRIVDNVRVLATKSYTSARGQTRTVRSIRLATSEEQAEIDKQDREASQKAVEAAEQKKRLAERGMRVWESVTGEKVKAKFVRLKSKSIVEFENEQGKKFDVRVKNLEKDDAILVVRLGQEDNAARRRTKANKNPDGQ